MKQMKILSMVRILLGIGRNLLAKGVVCNYLLKRRLCNGPNEDKTDFIPTPYFFC